MSFNDEPTRVLLGSGTVSSTSDLNSASLVIAPRSAAPTLSDLFTKVGLTPHEKANGILMSEIQSHAQEKLLQHCNQNWVNLDEYGQAKLSFLLLRKQEDLLYHQLKCQSKGETDGFNSEHVVERLHGSGKFALSQT